MMFGRVMRLLEAPVEGVAVAGTVSDTERGEQSAVVCAVVIRRGQALALNPRVLIAPSEVHGPRAAKRPVVFQIARQYMLVVGGRGFVGRQA